MDNKKYELTKESKMYAGVTLYRIKAIKSFGNVTKGDLGGFIQKESNLSQNGSCWVYGNARVWGNAYVMGNAEVWDTAQVYGNAVVSGNARVSGNAYVYGNARLWADHKVDSGHIEHGVTKFHEVIYG